MNSFVLHEIIGTALVGTIALTVLVLAEVLKRSTTLPTELTRKFAHIGSGFSVLLIPVFIHSVWTVAILTGGFALLMLVTNMAGLLQGVHGVGRGVGGVLWYPFTAWLLYTIVFVVQDGDYLTYAIPVLILACADAAGAVVGKRWGRHRYEVIRGHHRSVEGSVAFFIVAFLCVVIPLIVGRGVEPIRAIALGVVIAMLTSAYESVSVHGLDNLLVPFGALLFLDRFAAWSSGELAVQTLLLITVFATACVVAWRKPATGGGLSSFALSVYTVLVLGGVLWLWPMCALIATFIVYDRVTPLSEKYARQRYEMGTAMIGMSVPVILVLLHAALDREPFHGGLYIAYLASVASQAAILAFILPQNRAFRFARLRRMLTVRDPWQHQLNIPKILLSAAVAAATLALPLAARGANDALTPVATLVVISACAASLIFFVSMASTRCSRRSCPACGNVTLNGLSCCTEFDLGVGDTVSLTTLTFRKTYLLANGSAALLAVGVVIWMQ